MWFAWQGMQVGVTDFWAVFFIFWTIILHILGLFSSQIRPSTWPMHLLSIPSPKHAPKASKMHLLAYFVLRVFHFACGLLCMCMSCHCLSLQLHTHTCTHKSPKRPSSCLHVCTIQSWPKNAPKCIFLHPWPIEPTNTQKWLKLLT